jgi:Domain of unknown function (DUF383)/Domain of unknown function (DUF384)
MTSQQDDQRVYQDLLEFLQSPRADLRVAAMEAVLAASTSEVTKILLQRNVVVPLVRSCSHPDPVGVTALKTLLHLTSRDESYESQCIEDMIDAGALGRVTEIALSSSSSDDNEEWKVRVNWSLALMANMTRTERGAVELVGRILPDEAIQEAPEEVLPTKPALELLLRRFLNDAYVHWDDDDIEDTQDDSNLTGKSKIMETDTAELESRSNDPYQHFAAVLMNSAQTEAGRRFLLKLIYRDHGKATCLLQALLPYLKSKNPIRRRGIAGTVKNCCLETDSAWWLLNEINLIRHLLYPLAGPEELDVDEKRGLDPDLWLEGPDKVREPDSKTRLYLVESILLLCATGRKSRETIRLAKTYVILKWADMVEEEESVSERINECVQYLRRDEEGMPEGSSDHCVDVAFRPIVSSTASTIGNTDYDDVD